MLAALAILVAVGVLWKVRESGKNGARVVGYVIPQYSLADLNGQSIDSAKLRGKVVLVDFWATWCVPCESEIPHLIDWQTRYAGQGLQVVGLSMDDTVAPVKSYVASHKMDYPVAMADEKTIAAFGGALGLPVNILIGRDGRTIAKHVGVTDINVLQKEVEAALTAK